MNDDNQQRDLNQLNEFFESVPSDVKENFKNIFTFLKKFFLLFGMDENESIQLTLELISDIYSKTIIQNISENESLTPAQVEQMDPQDLYEYINIDTLKASLSHTVIEVFTSLFDKIKSELNEEQRIFFLTFLQEGVRQWDSEE